MQIQNHTKQIVRLVKANGEGLRARTKLQAKEIVLPLALANGEKAWQTLSTLNFQLSTN